MTTTRLLIVTAVAWLIAAALLIWMMQLAGMNPVFLIDNLGILSTLLAGLSVLGAVLAVVGALTGSRPMALIGAGAAVGWSVLGAAYVEMIVASVVQSMGGSVSLRVTAVSHAEALLVLLIGLTGALVGLGALYLRRR
ncbi:MAG: hypothetical protein J0L52_00175 [Caulobacterales bacterium]|nr:hypothetical protein [Caulobacterales bacterium]